MNKTIGTTCLKVALRWGHTIEKDYGCYDNIMTRLTTIVGQLPVQY